MLMGCIILMIFNKIIFPINVFVFVGCQNKKNDGFCVILESSRLDTGYGVQGSTHVIVRLKYRKLDNGP